MRLDLDTAHLILGTKGIMGIDPRCVPCSAKRRLSRQLEKRHGRDVLSSCDDSLRAILAESAEIPWRLDKSELFSKVLRYGDQVRSGEKPEQQVICLDLEYSSHTGKVFEIGAVDYFSGEVLCDVKVKQRCQGTNLGQTTPGMWTVSPSPNRSIDFKSYNKVFRQNAGTSLILDIHQIAVLLRSSITPETIVLVWAVSRLDLRLLRSLMERTGYGDFLPPEENCIPMVNLVRRELRDKKLSKKWLPHGSAEETMRRFPLSLPVIFPLIFVGHELVGRNHRAIVDVMQLRLMVQYLENNCRPSEDRNDDFLKYRQTNVQTKLDDNTAFRVPSLIDPSLS
jgi:hypothetical protein